VFSAVIVPPSRGHCQELHAAHHQFALAGIQVRHQHLLGFRPAVHHPGQERLAAGGDGDLPGASVIGVLAPRRQLPLDQLVQQAAGGGRGTSQASGQLLDGERPDGIEQEQRPHLDEGHLAHAQRAHHPGEQVAGHGTARLQQAVGQPRRTGHALRLHEQDDCSNAITFASAISLLRASAQDGRPTDSPWRRGKLALTRRQQHRSRRGGTTEDVKTAQDADHQTPSPIRDRTATPRRECQVICRS
jgi:hypothetical protein